MTFLGASVEYGLHCLLWLIDPRGTPASTRDLADFQGVPASLLAKILPRLRKAGIVEATGGIGGGYRLARPADAISVLDVVDAIEGRKPLFDCKEIRRDCALFDGKPPPWSGHGVCGIHAVMLRAEKAMRAELARTSLLDLTRGVRWPQGFTEEVDQWFDRRAAGRESARVAAIKDGRARKPKA